MSRETGWYMIWYLGDIRGNRLSKRVWEMQSFFNPYLERLLSVIQTDSKASGLLFGKW